MRHAALAYGLDIEYDSLVERGRSVAFLWPLKLLLRIDCDRSVSERDQASAVGGGVGGGGWGVMFNKKRRGKMPWPEG
jgi:hypothetical protein